MATLGLRQYTDTNGCARGSHRPKMFRFQKFSLMGLLLPLLLAALARAAIEILPYDPVANPDAGALCCDVLPPLVPEVSSHLLRRDSGK